MNIDPTTSGLTILRASRLEALVAPLHDLLAATRPASVLASQTVIAAHPGMKQWLVGALARHVGAGRIVANLDVRLPSDWLDGLSGELLGRRAVALSQYRRSHLRWTLHALLAEPEHHGLTDARVLGYLRQAASADERALRHFQLADRLARMFSQYLVYRADWLSAWEAGKATYATARQQDPALRTLEAGCLAPLWQATVEALGDHRGRLVQALSSALVDTDRSLPPVHVFGIAHLPPIELALLRDYARSAPVFLYVPDPCREYWGGLYASRGDGPWRQPDRAQWDAFRDEEDQRLSDPDALDWRDQGHPLLGRWGRLGQHFFAALAEGEIREDIRHWQDAHADAPPSRLLRVQESIRRLQPELMREPLGAPDTDTSDDPSLRIHACHTRLRELEVLRDVLLDAIAREAVRPGEIVVMAPDIQAYLPLIPSVFGEPGSARERLLPYHFADVPVARSHGLFRVFETLLDIASSRLTAPEVADLLAIPELRSALDLGAEDADVLIEWLQESRVAWAMDGRHKQSLALPPRPEHSFAWAMDRMLTGYLMADMQGEDATDAVRLPDETVLLPLAGIDGPSAAALGSLDRLLGELQVWRDLAERERPTSEWADILRKRVDALLHIDARDADARAALSVIHRAIAQLASEPAHNDQDPRLPLAVVRELLQGALDMAPERQRFLMGGITFCGMVPQRAIPFDVVCVLGLNEGQFPRRSADGGIDLMPRLRRLGDRDVAGDDRYLFLETLMSARKRLHLFYIGQGVRDGKHRNPAAPLAELMAELERFAGIAPDDVDTPRPWLVRHPLQPFDPRYFDGADSALFSYSARFAGMRGDGRKPLPRLREGALPAPEPLPDPIPLRTLEAWIKDPAKALLRDHLQLSLDARDAGARLPEDEPIDGIAPVLTVARRVFLDEVLPRQCADPDWQWDRQPPDWVTHGGILPLGEAGVEAWESEAAAVMALSERARSSGRFDARCADGGCAVQVAVSLHAADEAPSVEGSSRRISGVVHNVYPLNGYAQGEQVVFAHPNAKDQKLAIKKPEKLDLKDRALAFLQWSLLRLHRAGAEAPTPVRLTMLADEAPDLAQRANAWDEAYCRADPSMRRALEADLRRRVRGLIDLWRSAREGRSYYYPKAGWAAVQAAGKLTAAYAGGSPRGDSASAEDPNAAASEVPEPLPSDIATAVGAVWVNPFGGGTGERDYSPGYARLLEGDLIFGDPESDPDARALEALVHDAQALVALIELDAVDLQQETWA